MVNETSQGLNLLFLDWFLEHWQASRHMPSKGEKPLDILCSANETAKDQKIIRYCIYVLVGFLFYRCYF